MRCADAARMRGEPLIGSAVRYSRFLLLEVPGPWGTSALAGRHMEAGVARQLASAAAASGTHCSRTTHSECPSSWVSGTPVTRTTPAACIRR